MPELIQIIEHLEIFIGVGCLGYAIYKARREIQATWKRLQQRGIAFTPGDPKNFSISRYFDLIFVLFSSALFSLLLVASFIQKTGISDSLLLLWASLITFAMTGLVLAMWYIGKAELGIGVGAIITFSCIFIQPKGSLSLWLPVLILLFISTTMWIYEFGNPLEKSPLQENKIILFLILLSILVFSTLDLGTQYHYNLLRDKNTPKRFDFENKSYKVIPREDINKFVGISFNKYQYKDEKKGEQNDDTNENNIDKPRSLKDKKFLYTIFSDIQLVNDFYLKNYTSIFDKYFSTGSRSSISQKSDPNDVSVYFLKDIFDKFQRLNKTDQVNFLATRLKWIYPLGDDDKRVAISLPGLKVIERFKSLANDRTCNALLQTVEPKKLLYSFEYEPKAIPNKYKPKESKSESAEQQVNVSSNQNCWYEEEFTNNSKPFSPLLLKQLALPYQEEAYLAFKEYIILAQNILPNEYQNKLDDFFNGGIDKETQSAFIDYFTGDKGWENYEVFNKLSKYGDHKVTFDQSDKKIETLEEIKKIVSNNSSNSCLQSQNTAVNLENSASSTQDKGIVKFLSNTIKCLNSSEIESLENLINEQSGDYPLYYLFDENIKKWLDYPEGKKKQQQEVFRNLRNPIRQVFFNKKIINYLFKEKFIDENVETKSILKSLQKTINEFYPYQGELKDSEDNSNINYELKGDNKNPADEKREEVLHDIAYSLYSSADNSFLSPLNQIVITTTFIAFPLGLIVALLFQLPFTLAAVVLAQYAAQVLVTRDRLGTILVSEKSRQAKSRYTIGKTDMIRGRDSTISEMKKRAGRGWSSIAIVGRRGVGKTRILYELIQPDYSHPHPKGITAWVSAPTKFDESEFIESVLESLTADIEYTVAETLNAKPLEIRRIETNQTIAGIVIYSLCLVAFVSVALSVFSERTEGFTPDQAAFTLLPVGCIIVLSITFLILHYIDLQPVNLSSWLERDQVSNPQTALLYRDMRRVRAFLEQRRTFSGSTGKQESINYSRLILTSVVITTLVSFLASFILIAIFGIIFYFYNVLRGLSLFQFLLIISIAILLIIATALTLRREVARMRGYSLMSLVSEYREFVERTVYRIRQGALGTRPDEDFEIIVCIDELDKIVDPAELRNFIRRIKVIFEIPGVYYYLSLSEDALRTFYLGTADGKNEVDSAFDHIIYVPPVDCDLGEEIATAYLNKHSNDPREPGLERTIAAASYGVPRDILRRCDELFARGNIKDIPPSQVCDDLRKRLAELAYDEEILTKNETFRFRNNDIHIVFEEVEIFLSRDSSNFKAFRVVLAIWLLALLALSTNSIDEQWQQTSEDLRKIGYRIANENPQNLIEELRHIQETIWSL